ncbi:TenA family protein [Mailhella sp.]|uniref:TenA family protein n=1 Tax=Mailhella sp. TaxID=1981029 RepID=UPI00406300EC
MTLSRRAFLRSAAVLFASGLAASPGISCAGSAELPSFLVPGGWSASAWNAALPIFTKILKHPFICGLADGTLPQDVFAFYIRQDALYLESYARTLSFIAARLPKQEQRDLMTGFIKDTLAVERSMHELYRSLNEASLPPAPVKASPACQLYMSYETRIAATAPVEVACAVILPCFTVYQQTGVHLLAVRKKNGNPYKDWIDSYADPAFDKATRAAASLCDELAASTTAAIRAQMAEVYITATRMEWMFWDSAWKKEGWPV